MIVSFEGHELNLEVGKTAHNPFKRAMSYQALGQTVWWYRKTVTRQRTLGRTR